METDHCQQLHALNSALWVVAVKLMEATKRLIIFYGYWPWGDPQRMSKTIIHFPFSRRVTKILSVWPKTERLHRRFPRGLMCFRSSKHLPYLMSSIINKCMALIRLCLVGATGISCGGSRHEFLWRSDLGAGLGCGLWADAWFAFRWSIVLWRKKQTIKFCYSSPILLGALLFTSRGLISNVS